MLETLKTIFHNTSTNPLAEYYQSRLQATRNVFEVEAILSLSVLMSFNEQEKQQNEDSK
ncbi:hypothetical protein HQQ94_06285 [Shewanella sp. VB17]|uniref:hypothetical protein n=1 Tax=Shewanella sp. VB17 TaxID=2739432 RepID=UPI00156453E8|nr:hypothetical protein [Shewanella sp. VB17]NRD72851.1 hypothetical protein [Shewanella sp. VB17]